MAMLETHPARHAKHSQSRSIGLIVIFPFLLGVLASFLGSKLLHHDVLNDPEGFWVGLVGLLLLGQIFFLAYYYRKNQRLTRQLQRLRDNRQTVHQGACRPSQDLGALPPEEEDFKAFLASAPLEGIDLTRDRSLDRPVEL